MQQRDGFPANFCTEEIINPKYQKPRLVRHFHTLSTAGAKFSTGLTDTSGMTIYEDGTKVVVAWHTKDAQFRCFYSEEDQNGVSIPIALMRGGRVVQ